MSNRIVEADSEVPEVKVCSAALRLMLQILNWDFRGKNSVDNSKRGMDLFQAAMKQESSRRTECILVQVSYNDHRFRMCPTRNIMS